VEIGSLNGVHELHTHPGDIGFGDVNKNTYFHDGEGYDGAFQGHIGEAAFYDHALADADRQVVESYLQNRWINIGPIAQDDDVSTVQGAAETIDLLANDSDPDGDVLSVAALTPAENGTVIDHGDGTVTYTPNADFIGTDSFGYSVNDGQGGTDSAKVIVNVASGTTGQQPSDIEGLILWLDGADASTLTDTDGAVDRWADKSGLANDAFAVTAGDAPGLAAGALNGSDALFFDGSDMLTVDNAEELNTGGPYDGKTLTLAFATGPDVNSRQMLYEQGGYGRGLNVYIDKGELYLNGWNLFETEWGPSYATAAVMPETTHVISLVHDAVAGQLTGYLDGQEIGRLDGVYELHTHPGAIAFGNVNGDTYFHDGEGYDGAFQGHIGEAAFYDHALADTDRQGLENTLMNKWTAPSDGSLSSTMNEGGDWLL
jgi:hypothetical protein